MKRSKIKIEKGLDLPIHGDPSQLETEFIATKYVALLGDDVVGMKPSMSVKVGDSIKAGQVLYEDKKTEGVKYTSPLAGKVVEINRGNKRVFQSVVIEVDDSGESLSFEHYKGNNISDYNKESLTELLLESGLWPSLRMRPYSKVAQPKEKPQALFVNACDTHPLSFKPAFIIEQKKADFEAGLKALSLLCDKSFLTTGPDDDLNYNLPSQMEQVVFEGPHPAGLVGTHIHYLYPVDAQTTVWHINYQEVIAIGHLLSTGKLSQTRFTSLAGPVLKYPRVIETYVGAKISEIVNQEELLSLPEGRSLRKVSGSLLGGRKAQGPFDYLGRFHHQISVLEEGPDRELLGWHSPGFDRFSAKPIYLTSLFHKLFNMTTNTNGSLRSIVPIEAYEKVVPLDILPTFLLRSLMSGNTEMSQKLGALELDEEDLSLCTFVDPSKNDFAVKLRENLNQIEKEG